MDIKYSILSLWWVVLGLVSYTDVYAEIQGSATTQVVMLGTGTPYANPDRSGPSVAIVVNDMPYIVDFGPGVIRRASAMSPKYGGPIKGLDTTRIKRAFLTHLHSDHATGYPDLIFTPWVNGRNAPLEVYGPEGIVEMTDHIMKAYGEDIRYRLYGLEPANNQGWRVNAHTVKEGLIYQDKNVKVEAFRVKHGAWPNAFGYRFTTPDRVIVISGDAAPDANIEKYSQGVDLLIHEVYSVAGTQTLPKFWQHYHRGNHTSSHELGELAARVKPKLLVLYHMLHFGASDADILREVKERFNGDVVLAKDLDVF